jgi:hypothetical protein
VGFGRTIASFVTAVTMALLVRPLRAGDSSAPPTFYRDVLPILQKNCQTCHRPGEPAPMAFLTYASTRPWAKAMKQAVVTRRMPPWTADPRYGHFLNDRTLPLEDIHTITAWVDAGAPEGNPKEAPSPVRWPEGWAIPPDVVVSTLEPVPVPAKGTVELTDILVPSGFTKDTWVTSIEIRPGKRSVVHHVIVSVIPHQKDAHYGVQAVSPQKRDAGGAAVQRISHADRLRGLVGVDAVYVPGSRPMDYRLHQAAKLISKDSDLLIQVHYTPNGTAKTDQTKIGFTVAQKEPAHRFVTVGPTALRDQAHFHIPAGASDWATCTEVVFTSDAQLVWFLPHMHLRGKDMTYRLTYPNGESETVLSLKWDFNWQMAYDVENPTAVPKGTKLEVMAHFDNSANNRLNPNPNTDVWWGDQTWEEMMVPWFGVVVPNDQDPKKVAGYTSEFSGCSATASKRELRACRGAGILK